MLSNLPPGCRDCDLPGAHDKTISFTITFPYTIYNDDHEDLTQVIHDYTGMSDLTIDPTTITHNPDDSYTVMITYSDDIELDMSDIEDYHDLDEAIITYMNDEVRILDAIIDIDDIAVSIDDIDVH